MPALIDLVREELSTPVDPRVAAMAAAIAAQYPGSARAVLFYAAGVRLVAEGSPCLQELATLADAGVPLIACRTCLDYYGLIDQVQVGEIGNMLRIVEAQGKARKVVTV